MKANSREKINLKRKLNKNKEEMGHNLLKKTKNEKSEKQY